MFRSKSAQQEEQVDSESRDSGLPARTLIHCLEWLLLPIWFFVSQAILIHRSTVFQNEVEAHPILLKPPYPNTMRTVLMAIVIVCSAILLAGITDD